MRKKAPLLLLLATLLTLFGGARSYAQSLPIIELPDYPFWQNESYTVSEPMMQYQAANYCAGTSDPSAVQFFLGDLAYGSFDGLCAVPDAFVDELLGNLYISGYFGGVWLRDNLGTAQANQLVAQLQNSSNFPQPNGEFLDWLIFQGLTRIAGNQVAQSQTGSDSEIITAAYESLPGKLTTYGYNIGYVEVMLENPPEGIVPDPNALICGDYFLDCSSPAIELTIFDQYAPTLTHLQNPDSFAWWWMNHLVETEGIPAEQIGRAVWEAILADNPVATDAYEPLIDLSVGFLMVSDANTLASMTAWAENQPDAGRCALLLNAGMTSWAGAYFMGLASEADAGTFPSLTCNP